MDNEEMGHLALRLTGGLKALREILNEYESLHKAVDGFPAVKERFEDIGSSPKRAGRHQEQPLVAIRW